MYESMYVLLYVFDVFSWVTRVALYEILQMTVALVCVGVGATVLIDKWCLSELFQ